MKREVSGKALRFSERISRVGLSQTLALKTKADELHRLGQTVFDFSAGEPDFPTPDVVKEAGKQAIDANCTHYTSPMGIHELRAAIAAKYAQEHGASYEPDQVILTVGAKQALYNATQVLFQPGDEVLLPSPYWVTFPSQIALAGAKMTIIPTSPDNDFMLTSRQVETALSSKTRGLIMNSPSNPTGAVLSAAELESILALAKRHNFLVLSDECYESLVYDVPYTSASQFGPDNLVVINSFSKAYAMTGWRLGYALAPCNIISAMLKLQGHSTTHPSSISQYAALAALSEAAASIEEMRGIYHQRRDFVVEALRSMQGVTCSMPAGGFYVFPDFSAFYGKGSGITGSGDMASYLLEEGGVIVTPGEAFGRDEYIRLSFATSMETLRGGLKQIAKVLRTPTR